MHNCWMQLPLRYCDEVMMAIKQTGQLGFADAGLAGRGGGTLDRQGDLVRQPNTTVQILRNGPLWGEAT